MVSVADAKSALSALGPRAKNKNAKED
jgi:hypothetical protein